jgi:hypothetical protein
MRTIALCIVASLALTACLTTTTGVVKITDDTYLLSKQDHGVWSGSEVKVGLYQEANSYCAKEGKKFVQVSQTSVDAVSKQSSASAEIQFKCM